MSQRLQHLVAPAYLAMCLVLGGSAQGVWGNLLLQLSALILLAWAALTRQPSPTSINARVLGWLALALVLVWAIQLIPLPPVVWTALPGRDAVAGGFLLLRQPAPWLPISLAPYDTMIAALSALPALALAAVILRLGAYRAGWIAVAVVGATATGVALGALQVTTDNGYLYRLTSHGQAAGFFANANYMGTLLLAALPFIAALFARVQRGEGRARQRRLGLSWIAASVVLVLLLGLLLNRSTAAALLSLPVMMLSATLVLKPNSPVRRWLIAAAIITVIGGCLAAVTVPGLGGSDAAVSMTTRHAIYGRSLQVTADQFPFGSGLGSFASLYPRYEDPASVDWVFVNHAHNDYLEFVLEAGLPGLALILAFLTWWLRRTTQIWRSPVSGGMARAATIASGTILIHSLVDFPARTIAISALLAACIALMAEPRPRRVRVEPEVRARPARHLSLTT